MICTYQFTASKTVVANYVDKKVIIFINYDTDGIFSFSNIYKIQSFKNFVLINMINQQPSTKNLNDFKNVFTVMKSSDLIYSWTFSKALQLLGTLQDVLDVNDVW